MSCGMLIKTHNGCTYVDRISIKSYQDLQERIKQEYDWIEQAKNKLKQLAACTPKDMFPFHDGEDPFFQINREFEDLWESINESYNTIVKLRTIECVVDDWKYADENSLDIAVKENWDKICVND